jgi:site-specific DNA-methyltransferase (adenine-specific)
MKPLDGTFAENAQKWGVAGLNIDRCRLEMGNGDHKGLGGGGVHGIGNRINNTVFGEYEGRVDIDHAKGRWPANLIHDGSEEVLELFPASKSTGGGGHRKHGIGTGNGICGAYGERDLPPNVGLGDTGSAARFFYCAKASRAEREMGCEGMEDRQVNKMGSFGNQEDFDCPDGAHRVGDKGSSRMKNHHPTVKPLALMRYLCRLVTPPGGLVLDPFMGSGTTGMAAKDEGFRFIGIEKEPEYLAIAERRIGATA